MKPHRRREAEDISGERDNLAKFPAENPFPVLRIGADGIVAEANVASLPLLDDWNTEIGQSAPDFWRQTASETLGTNEVKKDIEFEHKGRTISFTAVPMREGDYINLYGLDVTERKWTDEALRRSEEQFRLLISSVKDYAIFMLNPIGLVVNWNEGAERVMGYRSEDIIGRHFSIFYPREERERDKPQHELDRATEQDWYEEQGWRKRKDGSHFWADMVITTLYDSDGKLKGFSNVTRDITERQQVEQELDNLAKLPAENPSPVLRIDADGTMTYANAAGLALLGDWHTEVGQRAPDFWRQLVADLLSANEMRSGIEVKHRDKILSITGVPIAEAAYVNFYGLDITERYRAEEERGRAQMLSDALNDINDIMSSTIVFDEIIRRTARAAVNALNCEAGGVILHEDGFWVPKHIFGGITESVLEERMTGSKVRHLDLAAKTNRLVIVDDAFNDPRADNDWMKELGIQSFIVSPLAIRKEIIGVLTFHYRSAPIAFSAAQVDFVEKLATSLSMVIENARSHDATKQSLSDTEALHRMSARFTQTLELDDILSIGLKEILAIVGVEHGCIYTLDANGSLSIKKQEKLTREFLEAKATISRNEGCAGQAVAKREVYAPTPAEHDYTCEDSKRLLGLDCMLAMPLITKGSVLGVLELFAPVHRRLFDRERRTVMAMVNQLAAAIENANLYSRERNIADTLQETLLTVPNKIAGIDFGHLYRSATVETSDVGGDFYDLFELGDDKVGITIGDVSGKGLKAATLTALVKNTIKAYAYEHDSPAKVVALTNDVIMRASELSEFVTLFFCILDKRTGGLTYCHAGHPPPIVKRAESAAYFLKAGGSIIGVFKDLEYEDVEDRLKNEDILFLYTDGAIEARCDRELFGEERLIDLIDRSYSTEIRKLPKRVLEKIMDFAKNTMADDTALLAVTLEGGPGGHEIDVAKQASEPTKRSGG